MTNRLKRGHSMLIKPHGKEAHDTMDSLMDRRMGRDRGETRWVSARKEVIVPKANECCRDPSNLVPVRGTEQYQNGSLIEVCKYCGVRHHTIRAGCGCIFGEPFRGSSQVVVP